MTSLNEKTCLMICGEEGFSRRTYFDSGQVNTWSFGITNASGFDVRKYIHQAATQDECVKAYLEVLNGYFREVCKALGDGVSLEVLTGATSFHWNTGAINRASWVR